MRSIIFIVLSLTVLIGFAQKIIAKAELEAENVDKVRIEASFVDVYVNSGDRVFFQGMIEGNGEEGDFRFDTQIVGSTLVIKVINNRTKVNWKYFQLTKSRIDLIIKDGVMLDIENSSGDVNVANLRASKSKIEATSGDITLKSMVANLEVETSSGDIEIDGLMGDSKIETTSGDQDLYNLKGIIKTRASSGDISVVKFDGEVDLEATSGDINIRGGEGALKVRTTSGNIDGENIQLTDNAYFYATSGDVEIDFNNDLGELSFDLTATSGDLEIGARSGEKRIQIDRGGFKVEGVTSSGNQEYN